MSQPKRNDAEPEYLTKYRELKAYILQNAKNQQHAEAIERYFHFAESMSAELHQLKTEKKTE